MGDDKDLSIGLRLKKARENLRWTLRDLARMAGFGSYQTLAEIEKGARAIKVSELATLSKFLYKDPWYFLTDEEPLDPIVNFAWRRNGRPDGAVELEARLRQILEDYRLLETVTGESVSPALPPWEKAEEKLSFPDVQLRAEKLVEELNLGFRPGVNLKAALEDKYNFRILNLCMGEVGSATTAYGELGVAIFINSHEAPWRRNFDLAHELFHYFSCKTYPFEILISFENDEKPYEEKLADVFAAALLMPEKCVTAELSHRIKENKIDWIELIDMAQEFAVSTTALLWRLVSLGILTNSTVKDLIDSPDFSNLDRQKREGSNLPEMEYSTRFVKIGLTALKDGLISKAKFCDIFGIDKPEFKSFIEARGFSEELIFKREVEVNNS